MKKNVNLKKLVALFFIGLMATPVMAQKELGFFNSVSVGTGVSTTGVDINIAAPIGKHFAVRGGVSIMPNITFNTDVNADVNIEGNTKNYAVDLEGALKRTSANLLVSYYPFKKNTFFVTAGAYFGGSEMVQIKGHSDQIKNDIAAAGKAGIVIGGQELPVDKNGDVAGGLEVKSFRPYLGLGFGRPVPKKRLGFLFELGVQFHGTPELYTDNGKLNKAALPDNDDTFTKIIDKLTVYPVMKFNLYFRTF